MAKIGSHFVENMF